MSTPAKRQPSRAETATPNTDRWPVFGSPPASAQIVKRLTAFGVIEHEGRIAIVTAPNGRTLPGGGIEDDETPVRAFERETAEECGFLIQVGDWTSRAVQFVPSESGEKYFEKISTFFEAHLVSTDAEKTEMDHEVSWLPPEEAQRVLSWESHVWAVQQWLAQR